MIYMLIYTLNYGYFGHGPLVLSTFLIVFICSILDLTKEKNIIINFIFNE